LYAAGGERSSNSSVYRYDAVTNTWTAAADMLEGRRGLGAVTIGSAGPADEQDLFDALIVKASSPIYAPTPAVRDSEFIMSPEISYN
jgi:hypothetical protein